MVLIEGDVGPDFNRAFSRPEGWDTLQLCTGVGNGGGGCGAFLLVEEEDLADMTCDSTGETSVAFRCISCGAFTDLPNSVRRPGRHLWGVQWWEDGEHFCSFLGYETKELAQNFGGVKGVDLRIVRYWVPVGFPSLRDSDGDIKNYAPDDIPPEMALDPE